MGELPWQGLRGKTKEEKYRKIKESKVGTPISELTKGYPKEFADYMNYCRNLGFTEDPDYSYLRRMFKELYNRCGFENDFIFDWTIQRYHAQINQETLGIEMGLRKQKKNSSDKSSDPNSPHGSEEAKVSLDNRYPVSNDDF